MTLFLSPSESLALKRVRTMLMLTESSFAPDFVDLLERLERLRMCTSCGNFGEQHGDTCGPCLDLEAIGEANEAKTYRGHQ